jgi:hypothetical protein
MCDVCDMCDMCDVCDMYDMYDSYVSLTEDRRWIFWDLTETTVRYDLVSYSVI